MPRESLSFDRVADEYDDTRGGERRGEQLGGGLAPLLDPAATVLEVGVGTGVIAKALTRRGFDVYGLDISPAMLQRAHSRLGPRVVCGDAMELPIASGSVAQAISVWVLHVVGDQLTVMREAFRVLRPGGRYFVMDGAPIDEKDLYSTTWREISDTLGWPPLKNRSEERAAVGREGGFRVVDIVRTGPYPFETSVAQLAEHLESRTNSRMWSLTDDDFDRVIRPVVARLRARPDMETPIAKNDYQDVVILERP